MRVCIGHPLPVSKKVNGRYGKPENLGSTINTEFYENDPFVAPDESYLVFQSNRPGGYGKGDLYVSFRADDGSWTSAKNLGGQINSAEGDGCPVVTPDGKYLFFSSLRRIHRTNFSETPLAYDEKVNILNSPGYGSEDIYWVDTKGFENLKRVSKP